MKQTALSNTHRDLGAKMIGFAGFEMPLEYTGVISENLAVRQAAGLFDVSHMGEFMIEGSGATAFLQYITTNNVETLIPGKAQYTCFPNGNGGIVDDLIVYRLAAEQYLLVVNASNLEKDRNWILANISSGIKFSDISGEMSLIAIQGPKAGAILQPLADYNISGLKSFEFIHCNVAGAGDVMVSATGYTGAGGFELCCRNSDAVRIWNALSETGAPLGLKHCGLAARDTLRLEMCYPLHGNEIDDSTSVLEAGLGWILKLNKTDNFIDKEFYRRQKEEGVRRKLVAFELSDRGIPRKDYLICDAQNSEIGRVTSGTLSPTLQKGIGMGYVLTGHAQIGSEVFVRVRDKLLRAAIINPPFFKN